jgi:pimeloyl-ACP methyl ester carboxylesterase
MPSSPVSRLVYALCLCALAPAPANAEGPLLPVPAIDQSALGARGYFYVGGHYAGEGDKEVMQGQIYVEVLAPKTVRRPFPLVLIHGAAQTATNWMGTPDGRKGWADYFVEQGYIVYMIDQPSRARSAWHPSDGATRMFAPQREEFQFTASEILGNWPQAKKHTQWPGDGPGKGRKGDPIFDAFYATQVETLISNEETQARNQAAAAALLDRIGPAIILTHSQSGPFGWLIADARPQLVKAILAVEPSGPPFENTINATGNARAYGVSDIPITYDPPIKNTSQLLLERQAQPDGPDLFACWTQTAPAPLHRLINLANIPVLIVTAEASYHAVYDHCTAKYLSQAGVKVDFVRLEDRGITGNGHMVMLEKNNLDIAGLIDAWVQQNLQ